MVRNINYKIRTEDSDKTIYIFLRERFFSAKMLAHLKHTENSVLLNGQPVFLNTLLKSEDVLTVVYCEDDESENIIPVNLSFKIVYEDDDIMVIDKPSDMPVHPAINNFDNTLANGLAYYFAKKDKHFVFRCINRLDRDTSGLLIVAKHRLAASILSDFMKKREIHREYLALASGIFDKKTGTVDLPIGRVGESIIARFVDFENGENAVTHYEVIEEYLSSDDVLNRASGKSSNASEATAVSGVDLPCSLIKLHLETGRTHQIRVHMSYIGHPLLGDSLYNKHFQVSEDAGCNKKPGSLTRQALHSHKIEFIHPITLEPMKFISNIDFFNL